MSDPLKCEEEGCTRPWVDDCRYRPHFLGCEMVLCEVHLASHVQNGKNSKCVYLDPEDDANGFQCRECKLTTFPAARGVIEACTLCSKFVCHDCGSRRRLPSFTLSVWVCNLCIKYA